MTYNHLKTMTAIALMILATACSSKEQKTNSKPNKDSISVPTDIHTVVGIGKVEPQQGIIDLASPTGGIIIAVEKKGGDSVKEGETILVLDKESEQLKIQQLKTQIVAQKQQMQSSKIDVKQIEAQIANKSNKLKISKKLAETGAETKENVTDLQNEVNDLEIKQSKSQNAVAVAHSDIKELQAQLNQAEDALQKKTIKLPTDGVIMDISAKAGGAIQALTSFAKLAPNGPWVVRGEADEMFANRLAIGQKVEVRYLGNSHIVSTGKIISLSPNLSNKSIFTDEPGEAQDRRVRRFKVLLDSKDDLLINSKVECNILIK